MPPANPLQTMFDVLAFAGMRVFESPLLEAKPKLKLSPSCPVSDATYKARLLRSRPLPPRPKGRGFSGILMKHLIAIAAIAISASSFAQNCTQVGNTVMCDNGVTYNRIGNTTFGSDGSTATDIGNTRFYDDGSTSTKIGNTRFYDNGETSTQIGGTRFNSDGTTCTQIGNMVSCF